MINRRGPLKCSALIATSITIPSKAPSTLPLLRLPPLIHHCQEGRWKHGGVLRLKVEQSPQVSGIRSTRGNRELNEDRYQRCTVRLGGNDALYCAVFDGHGGSRAADYCAANLHKNLETAYEFLSSRQQQQSDSLPPGATSGSAPPGSTSGSAESSHHASATLLKRQQTLMEQSLSMAFLETDQQFLATHPSNSTDGTTASVAVIQPIISTGDSTTPPPPLLAATTSTTADISSTHTVTNILTIGHIGDSRVLLCNSVDGKARQLTIDHSPQLSEERRRIEAAGGWISQDSFGQHAVMGMLATSRSIGVAKLKSMGQMIIAEPQVLSHSVDSRRDSFIVLMTDGVWNVMNNQECVDVVKHCKDPTAAAIALIEIAERYVTYDNATALVVRLDGWPLHKTPPSTKDYTLNLRRYKLRNSMLGARSGLPSSSSFIGETFIEQRTGEFAHIEDLADGNESAETATTAATIAVDTIPRTASGGKNGNEGKAVYQRQDIELFVIDLFDVIGKDMGGSDIFATDEEDTGGTASTNTAAAAASTGTFLRDISETDKYEFRDRMVKIGRASYHEIQDAIRQLGVRFQQPAPSENDLGHGSHGRLYRYYTGKIDNDGSDDDDLNVRFVDIADSVVVKKAFETVGHAREIDFSGGNNSGGDGKPADAQHFHIRALSSLSAADISRALKQLRIRILRRV